MINLQKGVAMTSIDTSGPRPWPGTATRDDIKPGAVIEIINDLTGFSSTYVVVSDLLEDIDEVNLITPEQAERFTPEQLVHDLVLAGIAPAKTLWIMGVQPSFDNTWIEGMCTIVTGHIK